MINIQLSSNHTRLTYTVACEHFILRFNIGDVSGQGSVNTGGYELGMLCGKARRGAVFCVARLTGMSSIRDVGAQPETSYKFAAGVAYK